MSNVSIKKAALGETVVEIVQWHPSDSAYRMIKDWGADVRRSEDNLLLQTPSSVETIAPSDWVVKTSKDKFWWYTDEEKNKLYVEVNA